MSSKKAALVINPRTGQNVAKITDVLAVLSAAGWKTTIALKEYGGHSMELAHKAASDKSDLVLAYGGDGTLSQVVNGVMDAKGQSRVGVIPGGTANVWAGEIGVPTDPVKAALSLVNSEPRKVDVGHVDSMGLTFPQNETDTAHGKNGHKKKMKPGKGSTKAKHHFLLMAGLGIDAAIMGNVSKPLKYRIGPLAVGLSAAKELPTQKAFPIEIRTSADDRDPLWRGEALQVVIGNTRRYGDIAEMTPNAYIDDGVLDVCVVTAGDPLTTMQQVTSLLLRKKPDNLTAEYFHGAHLYIKVPATVPMQLDGSAVKLKDYLEKDEYTALHQAPQQEQVMITYRFDAMPHALEVFIPRTYNNALFERSHSAEEKQEPVTQLQGHAEKQHAHVKVHKHKGDEQAETELQQRTAKEEARAASELHDSEAERKEKKLDAEMSKEFPAIVDSLLENGRKITVVGKVPNPEKAGTYIIAGGALKESTSEVKPVAVVVDAETTIFNRNGGHVPGEAIQELQEGTTLVVEGKKSKRGVIHARRMVM